MLTPQRGPGEKEVHSTELRRHQQSSRLDRSQSVLAAGRSKCFVKKQDVFLHPLAADVQPEFRKFCIYYRE